MKAKFAANIWVDPLYQAYRHSCRDRVAWPVEAGDKSSAWKAYLIWLRDVFIYIIRRYHYLLTIRTRVASALRFRGSTAADGVDFRVITTFAVMPRRSVLMVTYHPCGFISDHVRYLSSHFIRRGFSLILIKTVDDLAHPLADSTIDGAAAAMVRKNAGYDFGAWAHGLKLFPQVFQGDELWMVNDSIFGPANVRLFDDMLERIEKSQADLVGLTKSNQYTDHFQSYMLIFRNLPRWKAEIQQYWSRVRNIRKKLDVIFEYELSLTQYFSDLGLVCRVLFPVLTRIMMSDNPTFFAWRELLESGYPFLKVSLLKPGNTAVDNSTCREAFGQLGYDSRLIDAHLQTIGRTW